MFAVAISIFLACQQASTAPACPGLDASTTSVQERRAALDSCAAAANKPPIDYFLDRVEQLTPADRRMPGYCEVGLEWPQSELIAAPIAARLVSIARIESTAPDAARIVALRMLGSIPADKRPADCPAVEPTVIALASVPSRMTYDKKELTAAPGEFLRIDYTNADALEHNLLFVAPGSLSEIGLAGDRLGQTPDGKAKEFVPDSPKVLGVMGLVGPGKSKSMWFIAPAKTGTYPFVCTYPAHWRTMNGKLKVVAPLPPKP